MPYRTVSYARCHRCEGPNDRGSQRTCKSCHVIIQKEYRERKAHLIDALQQKVMELEDALAVALARAVAAESIAAARSFSETRHTSYEAQRVA